MTKENQKYNLFIVRSPLQFINAIEAKHHFKTQNNILCLIHNTSTVNSKQMNQLLTLTTWDKTLELNHDNSKNSLFNNIKFIKNILKYQFNYIFTGHLGNINIALISSLMTEDIFLIDDGTATIALHESILNPKYQKKITLNNLIREYRFKIFGLKCNIKNLKINYFTFFNITPHLDEKIIKNEFLFLKNNFKKSTTESQNTVYLLGQNLVEIAAMHEDIYIGYLKKIINYYQNEKIIYYPHRSETITPKYQVLEKSNFIIKKVTQAIEIELLNNNNEPQHIASFISSALFSLHNIFPQATVTSFILDVNDLLSHQEEIKMLYKNQDKNIKQINL
ncbi:MAG TPA: hypothetical protein EYG73_00145 [Arcobacter sp.]|nr:hypothetical protein [Arcobacter sp.]